MKEREPLLYEQLVTQYNNTQQNESSTTSTEANNDIK